MFVLSQLQFDTNSHANNRRQVVETMLLAHSMLLRDLPPSEPLSPEEVLTPIPWLLVSPLHRVEKEIECLLIA